MCSPHAPSSGFRGTLNPTNDRETTIGAESERSSMNGQLARIENPLGQSRESPPPPITLWLRTSGKWAKLAGQNYIFLFRRLDDWIMLGVLPVLAPYKGSLARLKILHVKKFDAPPETSSEIQTLSRLRRDAIKIFLSLIALVYPRVQLN